MCVDKSLSYICIYIYIYIYIHKFAYIYIHIYVHIHTSLFPHCLFGSCGICRVLARHKSGSASPECRSRGSCGVVESRPGSGTRGAPKAQGACFGARQIGTYLSFQKIKHARRVHLPVYFASYTHTCGVSPYTHRHAHTRMRIHACLNTHVLTDTHACAIAGACVVLRDSNSH